MEAIEITNICKVFNQEKNSIVAIDNISFSINRNELFGLLGVNGAGKSTLIKMISGLLKPTSGKIMCFGKNSFLEKEDVKKMISISFQEIAIAEKLTVLENLVFIARLYGLSNDQANQKAKEVIKSLSLTNVENSRAKILSGGYQRRLSIAMALITSPKILILDEPTLGLDVIARRELWELIKELKNKITIILTTHYLEEAEALCDRIAILVEGKVKAIGNVSELKLIGKNDSFEEAFINIVTRKGE